METVDDGQAVYDGVCVFFVAEEECASCAGAVDYCCGDCAGVVGVDAADG